VVGVQVGHEAIGVGELGCTAGGGGEHLTSVAAHVLRDVDALLPARLRRPEEAREQVVPISGSTRSDRSDAHKSSSLPFT
jgi:hypothetical protein